MDITDEQHALLYAAWATAQDGDGIVITDDAYPAADALAQAGWLERRVERDGELSWHWTHQAEVALLGSTLTTSVEGRQN